MTIPSYPLRRHFLVSRAVVMKKAPLPPSLREVAARSADGGSVLQYRRHSPSHGYRRDSPLIEGAKCLCHYRNCPTNRKLRNKIAPSYDGASCVFAATRVCKPGSVIDSHLSKPKIALGFQPPPRSGRANQILLHGVAPDRVYIVKPMFPWAGCALTAPFHPC